MKIKLNQLTGSIVGAVSAFGALAAIMVPQAKADWETRNVCACEVFSNAHPAWGCEKGDKIGTTIQYIDSSLACSNLDFGFKEKVFLETPPEGGFNVEAESVIIDNCMFLHTQFVPRNDQVHHYCD